MAKHKRVQSFIIIVLIICISASSIVNAVLSKPDYAKLVLNGKYNSYILLNDSEKYVYMHYYNYSFDPDLTIREGKNYILSLFKKGFEAYSNDPERNFLYSRHSGLGVQLYGLYVKESALDDLFEPTAENIHRILVLGENDDDSLIFNAEDEKLFDYFIQNYSDELCNYFFPIDTDDRDVLNSEYTVTVEYQNGEISRFLRCIDKEQFEALYSMKNK